eukprot:m.344922 g.344922  ORF g.344922 m.344922 type:complete len:478 (-) comp25425_c0_seq1:87-1520(-)
MAAAFSFVCVVVALVVLPFTEGSLSKPELLKNGTFVKLSPNTSPVPIGLYSMLFVHYDETDYHNQFPQISVKDFQEIIRSRYIKAISMHFTWADIQPTDAPCCDPTLLNNFLTMLDKACALEGLPHSCLPIFMKPYFAHEPSWTYDGPPASSGDPFLACNNVGMKVLVQPRDWNPHFGPVVPNVTIPISTDPGWQNQVAKLTAFLDSWLAEIDPNATRIPIVHFAGPVMTSLQMRPGPSQMFDSLSNDGYDKFGMEWTKAGHIKAWTDLATAFKQYPAMGKRAWAFDFTVLPPKSNNASFIDLDTSDQVQVFEALAAAHPDGPGAVIAKTESLHVDLAKTSHTCAFVANATNPGSFASQSLEKDDIAYQFIMNRTYRHGWENFAPLEMPSLPYNKSDIPSMFPLSQLITNSLYSDLGKELDNKIPNVPAGAIWAEIWRYESTNTSAAPSCVSPSELSSSMAQWDSRLREEYKRSLEL